MPTVLLILRLVVRVDDALLILAILVDGTRDVFEQGISRRLEDPSASSESTVRLPDVAPYGRKERPVIIWKMNSIVLKTVDVTWHSSLIHAGFAQLQINNSASRWYDAKTPVLLKSVSWCSHPSLLTIKIYAHLTVIETRFDVHHESRKDRRFHSFF